MIVPACTRIQTIWIFWDAYCPDISVIAKIRQFCNRFEILILTQLILKMRHSLRQVYRKKFWFTMLITASRLDCSQSPVRSFRYTASYRHGYLDFQMYRGSGCRGLQRVFLFSSSIQYDDLRRLQQNKFYQLSLILRIL